MLEGGVYWQGYYLHVIITKLKNTSVLKHFCTTPSHCYINNKNFHKVIKIVLTQKKRMIKRDT